MLAATHVAMTEFDAALYFFTVMFGVLLFVGGYDRWLARYDKRISQARRRLSGDRRELLDLFDQERDQ